MRRPSLQSAHRSAVFNLRWDASRSGHADPQALRVPPAPTDGLNAAVAPDPPSAVGTVSLNRGRPLCDLVTSAALGEHQNNVSNHLAKLRRAGLVRASRHMVDARWVYYERDDAACRAARRAFDRLLR